MEIVLFLNTLIQKDQPASHSPDFLSIYFMNSGPINLCTTVVAMITFKIRGATLSQSLIGLVETVLILSQHRLEERVPVLDNFTYFYLL